ncbi:S9 family peptidase [Clavibacter michiganensis subsp. phaseoli]|uniref:S9 family peptidase n=1 Tax=Clavibacter phaseoli TaxID=1734031 RepID=A0A8I0SBR5_9MICO|nr:S9 family peptidase [Clavibacter phaseoli]MBF4631745.1 S9 family peptidase [Clavibacter phaseoli]
MKTTDLDLLTSVSRPAVSPDGRLAVVSVTRPRVHADAYTGQLWEVTTDGSAPPRRITRGFRDTSPRLSPDGAVIAFLRAEPTGAPQLHVVRATGGEPVALTDELLGVGAFDWSPDGSRIVYAARVAEPGRYGSVEGVSPAAEPARRITTTKYLANGLGWSTDRHTQLSLVELPELDAEPFVAAVPSGYPDAADPAVRGDGAGALLSAAELAGVPPVVRLTDEPVDHDAPRFSADGSEVLFVASRHDGRDDDLLSGAYAVAVPALGDAAAGVSEVRTVVSHEAGLGIAEVASVDGGRIYLLAQDLGETGVDFVARNTALYVLDADDAAPRVLTDAETVDLGGSGITVEDRDAVLVLNGSRGTVQLLRVTADGAVEALVDDQVEVTAVGVGGGAVVVALTDPRTHGDLALVRADRPADGGSALVPLTDFSAPLRESGIRPLHELVVEGRDGYPVHGWVVLPEGEGPHPVLLVIHGGPYAAYGVHLFDEAQVYADAGYAVLLCNPRGAAGYGQAHGRVIKERMGTVDMQDVLDFLDGAIAVHESIDGSRAGIMGGSYGGYLTAWTIAHEHRFQGAIVERGFLDPELFTGTSDIGTFFGEEYTGHDEATRRAQSPQAFAHQVRTPTFVVHSEDDLRCPLSQAERYHLALVRAGVETEMLVFPGEDHELSRSGRPRHRVQRFEAILDWWDRHLPVAGGAR